MEDQKTHDEVTKVQFDLGLRARMQTHEFEKFSSEIARKARWHRRLKHWLMRPFQRESQNAILSIETTLLAAKEIVALRHRIAELEARIKELEEGRKQ